MKIKACVIGAGAAGLCAARHLSQYQCIFDFDVYEQTSKVGGIWNYTEKIGLDENGLPVHTSLYKNMKTNLPIEIMEFQDFGSKSETSFVSHTRVLKYLEEYAKHFNLFQYIKFNRQIIRVIREENDWKVIIKDLKTNEMIEKIYNSMFVCNGRYSQPLIPNDLIGIENFKGKVIHSHDYRVPEVFAGQVVLVLGAGPSGIDISIELSETAKQVVFCHRNAKPLLNLPQNIRQELNEIKEIFENEIELKNGNRFQINSIIFTTGYRFDFSFLDNNCAINVNTDGRVEGVYLHLINQTYPSMAIFALPMKVVPFPLYHQQVLLPTKEEMERQTQEEVLLRLNLGLSERYFHKMVGNLYFDYLDKLSDIANITPIRPVFKKLYQDLEGMRKHDLSGYKSLNFQIISDEEYVIKQ